MQYEVVIVGGGPVGLATALELGQRGVRCLLAEASPRVGNAPRAKTTNVRTCEHLRRWGIVDRLRARAPFGIDYPSDICFATRMNGVQLVKIENASHCMPGRNPLYSEHAQWIPQYKLEETLYEQVQSLPAVTVRFNCRFEAFEDLGDRVRVTLEDLPSKAPTVVTCDYLVGADGAKSRTRELMGVRMSGKGAMSDSTMVIFRCPGLARMHDLGPAVMYWLINGDMPAVLGPMDTGDLWYIGFSRGAEDADWRRMIRAATGLDLEPEIVEVFPWKAHQLIADRYRIGRVFLAGDACHLHPPFGGYGMNLGIGDGVDLGWKMAATLRGWGGPGLLDSYEAERRPVHMRVIEEAVANYAVRAVDLQDEHLETVGPFGDAARERVAQKILSTKTREFSTLGVVLGYRYTDSPIVAGDGAPSAVMDAMNFVAEAQAGARAPHLWLRMDDTAGASLFDHFGTGYTLLVTNGPIEDAEPMRQAAESRHLPLTVISPDAAALPTLYGTRFVLIRPDQHIAWRGDVLPADCLALVDKVTGRLPDDGARQPQRRRA